MTNLHAVRFALAFINVITVVSLINQRSFSSSLSCVSPKYGSTSRTRLHAQEDGSRTSVTRKEEVVRAAMKEDREVADPTSLLAAKKNEMVTAQLFDAASLDETFLQSLTAKRSYYSIVAERLMQTLDDYQLSASIKESNKIAMQSRAYTDDTVPREGVREKLVVLGTGWGSHAFLKTIDATKYDVQVISPRNYFMFTPMLAASAVGTVEFRSICEPIRNVNPFADYLEATATSIDSEKKGERQNLFPAICLSGCCMHHHCVIDISVHGCIDVFVHILVNVL